MTTMNQEQITREEVYKSLEGKMLSYDEYLTIPLADGPANEEALIRVPNNASLTSSTRLVDPAMRDQLGDIVYLRWSAVQKLRLAGKLLLEHSSNLRLEVVYGYRPPEVQRSLFETRMTRLRRDGVPEDELIAATHRQIAVPEAAGHPTGGALDLHLIQDGEPVDMGTPIWSFTSDSFTFSPFISREAWRNRQLLRRVMMEAGFAPFDGEWWHFSYGDKEWAKYYSKGEALYDQIEWSEAATGNRQ